LWCFVNYTISITYFQAFERKARELSGAVSQGGSHSCKCGNINVIIQKGTITKQRCDVMVITASKELKLKYGALSKSVLEAAGPDIQTACDNNYPSGVDYGDVAATRAYKLHCRFVYFGSLPDWKNASDNPQQVLTDFITNCLEKAHSHDTKSKDCMVVENALLKEFQVTKGEIKI
ncbi:poly, partial [Mytilus galloprovincialis]